jgi:hypothetical protein
LISQRRENSPQLSAISCQLVRAGCESQIHNTTSNKLLATGFELIAEG